MLMKDWEIDKLLEIGTMLSFEKNYERLLERILTDIMELTSSDAGTLYLREGDRLVFKIMRNNTLNSYQGGKGEAVDLPPVKITEKNVCAYALIREKPINIEDVRLNREYDFSGPIQYDTMTGYHTKSMLVVPMKDRTDQVIGVMQLINAKDENGAIVPYSHDMERIVESVACQTAIAMENTQYVSEIRELFLSFVRAFSSVIDERIPFYASHTRNMALYGAAFIDYLNKIYTDDNDRLHFSPEKKEAFLMSVWLHDIGKLTTPRSIMNKATRLGYRRQEVLRRFDVITLQLEKAELNGSLEQEAAENKLSEVRAAVELILEADTADTISDDMRERMGQVASHTYVDTDGIEKPWLTGEELNCLSIYSGTLTAEEREIMKNHVVATERLLSQIHFSKEYEAVSSWACKHHEFLNGSGYPKHLTQEELPKEARIITILDIFEALTASDRPYKPKMTSEKAGAILTEMAEEGKLDAELVRLFMDSHCWE